MMIRPENHRAPRTEYFQSLEMKVIRFDDHQALAEPDAVVQTILRVLECGK